MKTTERTKKELIEEIAELKKHIRKRKAETRKILKPATNISADTKYQILFNSLTDAVCIHDLKGHFLQVNDTLCKRLGYSRKALFLITPMDIYTEKNAKLVQKRINTLKKQGHLTFETEHVTHKGKVIPVEVYSRIIDYDGAKAVLSVARDITARKRFQTAIQESENKYRNLVENINDVLYHVDKKGFITYISSSLEQHTGYKPSEVIGRSFTEFIHTDDLPSILKQFEKVLSGNIEPAEYRITTKTGGIRWIHTSSRPIYENGVVVGLQGVLQNITERKEIEDALKKSYDELRLILDATTEGIWQWDFRTDTLYFSEKWYTMLGYEPYEFPASYENWSALMHPDDRVKALAVVKEYLKTKPDRYENEFRLRTKDGQYRWIRAHAKVVERNGNGKALRLIGNHQDFTERRQAEEALINKMSEVERLNMLFIGREHRMIQLKREVNDLLAKLGQPKKYKAPDQIEPSMNPGTKA